jgi:Zn-dependent M28 family amino/carboxypeptidase
MVNLDMVGRNDPDHLLLGGTQSAPALGRAIERANESVGMKLERMRSGRLDGASDHASFQAVGIPSLFLFTGDHRDYHRVTDHADKIDAQKIARVGRLAFLIGAEVADDASAGKDREAAKAEAEERAARRRARAEGRGQGEGRGEGGERRRGRRAEGGEERPGQPAPETPTPAPAPKAEPAKKDGAWF